MSTSDSALAYRLLCATPADTNELLDQLPATIAADSPLVPVILWRLAAPDPHGSAIATRLLRRLTGGALPTFAVEAVAKLLRSTAGEPLQKELVAVLEGNTSHRVAVEALLELSLSDEPRAHDAAWALTRVHADLSDDVHRILGHVIATGQPESVALLGAVRTQHGAMPGQAVECLLTYLEAPFDQTSMQRIAARALGEGAGELPAVRLALLSMLERQVWTEGYQDLVLPILARTVEPDPSIGERIAALMLRDGGCSDAALALAAVDPDRFVQLFLAETFTSGYSHGISYWLVKRLNDTSRLGVHRAAVLGPRLVERLATLLQEIFQAALANQQFAHAAAALAPLVTLNHPDRLTGCLTRVSSDSVEMDARHRIGSDRWLTRVCEDPDTSLSVVATLADHLPSLRATLANRVREAGSASPAVTSRLHAWTTDGPDPTPGSDAAALRQLFGRVLTQTVVQG